MQARPRLAWVQRQLMQPRNLRHRWIAMATLTSRPKEDDASRAHPPFARKAYRKPTARRTQPARARLSIWRLKPCARDDPSYMSSMPTSDSIFFMLLSTFCMSMSHFFMSLFMASMLWPADSIFMPIGE